MTLCILHLGAEKTGTSSIQKYFGVHREALLREGTWYPESFTNPPGHVHIKLSSAAIDGSLDSSDPQGAAFRAELDGARARGAKTVVFSSEFFHSELRDEGGGGAAEGIPVRFFRPLQARLLRAAPGRDAGQHALDRHPGRLDNRPAGPLGL